MTVPVAAMRIGARRPRALRAAGVKRRRWFVPGLRRALRRRLRLRRAALDDLVELAAVEPDAAALRAIVDLDPLPIAHRERHAADRTLHGGDFGFCAHQAFSPILLIPRDGCGRQGVKDGSY